MEMLDELKTLYGSAYVALMEKDASSESEGVRIRYRMAGTMAVLETVSERSVTRWANVARASSPGMPRNAECPFLQSRRSKR